MQVTFSGALTIVFVVLKLLGKITWTWVWVLSPIWITMILAGILIISAIILALFTKKMGVKRWKL